MQFVQAQIRAQIWQQLCRSVLGLRRFSIFRIPVPARTQPQRGDDCEDKSET